MSAKKAARIKRNIPLYIMLAPTVVILLIYSYAPMAGLVMAFQNFIPSLGFLKSKWVGLDNFRFMFQLPNFWGVVRNTLLISSAKLILGLLIPLVVALMLNEVRKSWFKRTVQTLVYVPYFLSWVVLARILLDILNPQYGIVNALLGLVGVKPISFLADPNVFPWTMVITGTWQSFGYNTIFFLAALTSVDPALYESAVIDGAGKWKQMWHISLPGMSAIIILLAALSLGNILNAGFDQIVNLYNMGVYSKGDILDTLIFRTALQQGQYSLGAAIGLIKGVIGLGLISTAYYVLYKVKDYRIF